MRFAHVMLLSLITTLAVPVSQAETLAMDQMKADDAHSVVPLSDTERNALATQPTYAMEVPGKGMCMDQVEERFPPITRWIYDKYTVYFENRCVIHSVLN